jgi:hypothetical protein
MINNKDKENAISLIKDLADLRDIYSHLPATIPAERRKAFLISIINQHKFNERGHDKIPRSLPCPNPYLLSDRVQINRTKSNG